MKLSAVLLSIAGSAAAFAPAHQQRSSTTTALAGSFENEAGVVPPLNFFDPLGILDGADQEYFDQWRGAEIKHGRVSMLAVTGYLITQAGIRFPGAEDIPAGLKAFPALYETSDGQNVIFQMFLFFILAEEVNRDVTGKAEFVGDFRNGAIDFGWDKQTDAWKLKKRNIELNQGRAAMMGITGLVVHEMIGVNTLAFLG